MDLAELDLLRLVVVAGGAQDDEERVVVVLELRAAGGRGARPRPRARGGRRARSTRSSSSSVGLAAARARRTRPRRRRSVSAAVLDRQRLLVLALAVAVVGAVDDHAAGFSPGRRLLPSGDSVQTARSGAALSVEALSSARSPRQRQPRSHPLDHLEVARARPRTRTSRLGALWTSIARLAVARRRARACRAGWRACRRRRSRGRGSPRLGTWSRSASLRSTQSSIASSSVSAATSSPTSTPKRSTTSPTVSSVSSTHVVEQRRGERRLVGARRARAARRPDRMGEVREPSWRVWPRVRGGGCRALVQAVRAPKVRGRRARLRHRPAASAAPQSPGQAFRTGAATAPAELAAPAAARVAGGGCVNETVGRLALGRVRDLEELAGREAAARGDDRVREDLDLRVVGLDVRVVDPARRLDLVLELGEVARELLEVLGRAQLRVLLGDDAQPAERLA